MICGGLCCLLTGRERGLCQQLPRAPGLGHHHSTVNTQQSTLNTRQPPQEEEIRRAAEERQKREDAEAAKWLGQISVEEAGVDNEEGGGSGEGLGARLVAYIQERKMVGIDEVGGHILLVWVGCVCMRA